MIAWLFWPSLVVLLLLLPGWTIATFAPELATRIAQRFMDGLLP